MSILDQLMGYQGDHPKDVAKAYYQLSQQLKKDEGSAEEQQWREHFQDAKLAGVSPGQVHNPQTGRGFQPEGSSDLDKWKSQIDGLIQSGNPVLQKQGLDMISQYQQRATAPDKATDTRANSVKEYQFAVRDGYEGSYTDFLNSKKTRMFQPKLTTVPDTRSLKVMPEHQEMWQDKYGRKDVGVGMNMEEISPYVYSVDPKRVEEAQAAGAVATNFRDQLMDPEKGIYSDWGEGVLDLYKNAANATVQKYLQNDPRIKTYEDSRDGFVALLAKSLGESGNLAIQDIARAKKLIPTVTLPFPDSKEVATRKLDMLDRIIAANDSGDYAEVKKILDRADGELIGLKQNSNMPPGATGVAK